MIKNAHTNLGMLDLSDAAGKRTVRCPYSPTISKFQKYSAFAKYVKVKLGYSSCEIFPLVFGARGFVPSATANLIGKLLAPAQNASRGSNAIARNILTRIMHIIFRAIVVIYKTWQSLPRHAC